jgi:HK97 gp10 family phage protein
MKIEGKDKFLKQLTGLPKEIRKEVKKALQASATETTDLMKRFAPVESGRLRASIGYTFDSDIPKGALSSDARAAKLETDMAVVMYAGGGDAFYARFQEFGTTEMSANPFFFPGYRFGRKRAKSRLQRAVRNGAKKAFGK